MPKLHYTNDGRWIIKDRQRLRNGLAQFITYQVTPEAESKLRSLRDGADISRGLIEKLKRSGGIYTNQTGTRPIHDEAPTFSGNPWNCSACKTLEGMEKAKHIYSAHEKKSFNRFFELYTGFAFRGRHNTEGVAPQRVKEISRFFEVLRKAQNEPSRINTITLKQSIDRLEQCLLKELAGLRQLIEKMDSRS